MLSEKWRINLLNGLEVTGNGKRIDRFRGRTSAELLAILVLTSQRFVTREEIAGTIWPDSTPEAGRAGLRTALASLRGQLEPPGTVANSVLKADRVGLRLSTDAFTADVLDFMTASALAESARTPEKRLTTALEAVGLYVGELLPGHYSEWVLIEREKLHQSYRLHLSNIVSLYRSRDQFLDAIPYGRQLIVENPYDEEGFLLTMRLCIEAGRKESALQCFDQLTRTLFAEFETRPSESARELERTARQMPEDNLGPDTRRQSPDSAGVNPNSKSANNGQHDGLNTEEHAPMSPQPTGLPIPLTRFFGRDTEIMHIVRMIRPDSDGGTPHSMQQRLVTLTGTGGTGKTRIAIEIGAILKGRRQIPVTFVPLADINDPHRILDAIAHALRLAVTDGAGLLEGIVAALSAIPHLLILDNIEQLLTPGILADLPENKAAAESQAEGIAVEAVGSLLERVPSLCCLVTSRRSLRIDGEQEYPLQPLPTPAMPATPERLLDFASVKLFVDRAQLSRPEFQLTSRNADIVRSICTRLDGLPLALELAAAWSSSLSPGQILERLAQRFDLLVGRKSGRAARHASLKAALEWSFNLLSLVQQQFFSRLSVFRGGWTAQAAECVCEEAHALETLDALRDRSLVLMNEVPNNTETVLRYRLLESLREYASEQLTNEEHATAKRRHLEWYASWTDEASTSWSGTEQQVWLQRVQIEEENIHAALQFGLIDANPASTQLGMRIMSNLGHYWALRGNYTDARELFSKFLMHGATQEPGMLRANALLKAGSLASFQADWLSASDLYQESLRITRICEPSQTGSALISLGNAALGTGDLFLAKRYYQDSLQSYQGAATVSGVAAAYGALGQISMNENDYETALPLVLHAVDLNRQNGNLSGVTHHLKQLALCYADFGDQANARACLSESLDGYRALKDLRGMAELFVECAEMFPITKDSVSLLGAAHTLNLAVSATPEIDQQLTSRCRVKLGDVVFDEAWRKGQAFSTEQSFELAASVLLLREPNGERLSIHTGNLAH